MATNVHYAADAAPRALRRSLFWFQGLGRKAASLTRYLQHWRVMNELHRLSDRELEDIGLKRSEIATIWKKKR